MSWKDRLAEEGPFSELDIQEANKWGTCAMGEMFLQDFSKTITFQNKVNLFNYLSNNLVIPDDIISCIVKYSY